MSPVWTWTGSLLNPRLFSILAKILVVVPPGEALWLCSQQAVSSVSMDTVTSTISCQLQPALRYPAIITPSSALVNFCSDQLLNPVSTTSFSINIRTALYWIVTVGGTARAHVQSADKAMPSCLLTQYRVEKANYLDQWPVQLCFLHYQEKQLDKEALDFPGTQPPFIG